FAGGNRRRAGGPLPITSRACLGSAATFAATPTAAALAPTLVPAAGVAGGILFTRRLDIGPLGVLGELLVLVVGQRRQRGRRQGDHRLRSRRRPFLARLAIEPFDLLLGAAQRARSDDLDLDVELAFEVGQLATARVVEGIGELGVEADAHRLQ